MLFEINKTENINKMKMLLERNNIEYRMEPYPFSFMLKEDIECVLEDCNEYENLTEQEKEKISEHIEEYMWNNYDWSEYNDIIRHQARLVSEELRIKLD